MVETTRLPEGQRAVLERLVETSGFFALAARARAERASGTGAAAGRLSPVGPPNLHRDTRQIDLEIEDEDGRKHTLRLDELAASSALRDLVDRAWAAGGRVERS